MLARSLAGLLTYPAAQELAFSTQLAVVSLDLGTLGGVNSVALSINNIGQIVGYVTDGSQQRATLFDPTGAGNSIDLSGLTGGGSRSWAHSINDAGQIVGWVREIQSNYCATLFDPTGGGNNIDLNTLIDPNSGWYLRAAYSINNHGWIVGMGYNPDGKDHAFLLIPEPATIALLGLGALILRKKYD